jgi:hypothetical protein
MHFVIREFWRVLKQGRRLKIVVPIGKGWSSFFEHKATFAENSWIFFTKWNNPSLTGYEFKLVEKEIKPVLDNIFKGAGSKQALPKTELLEKLSQVEYVYRTTLGEVRKEMEQKYQENKNKIDSTAKANGIEKNRIDSLISADPSQITNTDSLFNTLYPDKSGGGAQQQQQQQQPQQPQQPQQQRTDNVVPPKFVDPFIKKN